MVDKCVRVLSTIGQQVFEEAVVAGRLEQLESRLGVLAGAGSLALLLTGVWLHEKKGRTDAAVAASSAAIAALFLTIAYAAHTVIAPPVALGLALAAGAVASTLAVRWESRLVGALGM